MPIYSLPPQLIFPPVSHAEPDGLLAIGGDLSPDRLILAYQSGIFPWFSPDEPILWWSPDPRFVMHVDDLNISKSMKQVLRRQQFDIRFDTAFAQVIEACGRTPRPGQAGTWITEEMKQAYITLHEKGLAHSAEAWLNGQLVGGLYGISMGGAFFGESMFAHVSNSSKAAFITLVQWLKARRVSLIDCQVHTEHLESLGAEEIDREEFIAWLQDELEKPTMQGKWEL
ncbi:MAG: leucyl/phenylalanyl-tRNA--protein transferase [Bacteroidia bacterium]|nr:leucyl/phenylalanyl-tRNA--protein transferase [Bacteroidia bacterium]